MVESSIGAIKGRTIVFNDNKHLAALVEDWLKDIYAEALKTPPRWNCMVNLSQETSFDKNHLKPEGILSIAKPDIAYGKVCNDEQLLTLTASPFGVPGRI